MLYRLILCVESKDVKMEQSLPAILNMIAHSMAVGEKCAETI